MVPERKWLADKLPGKISKINRPTDINTKMILFNSALNVFKVQTLDLNNFIQDYFRETITDLLAVPQESGFFVMQKTFHEKQKYRFRDEKSIGIFYSPESYRD
jgi:hypothetical protein